MRGLLSALACAFAANLASAADPADLPPAAEATAAIAGHPLVRAAQAGIDVEQALSDRLRAGTEEFALRVGTQQRRADPGDRFFEWEVAVERPIRLPRKADIDGRIGEQGVNAARLSVGDAMHETSRQLLRQWFAWLREASQQRQWQRQAELLRQQAQIVAKRVQAGDAAPMEEVLARAAVAQAESSLAQARAREAVARSELARQFPEVRLPDALPAADPQPLEQGFDYWRERVLAENHELAVARAAVQRARLQTDRAEADRTPDPTVGVRYASERDGAERLAGVFITLPLPGEARAAGARAHAAQAEVALRREAAILQRLEAEVAGAFAAAQGSRESWQRAREAAAGIARSAELAARAYALGESPLTDVLNARRLGVEAALMEALARLEASEARYRLMLDAHLLWPLDADEPTAPGSPVAVLTRSSGR